MSEGGGIGPGDKDRLPIQFSEEYRRAKRNALFWAAVTILIATGSPTDPSHGTEVGGLVRNLEFSPSVLLLGSVIVLCFMFAGYIRAERRLTFEHTDIGVARRLTEAADIAADLHNLLRQAVSSVERTEEALAETKKRIAEAQRKLSGLIRNSLGQMTPISVRKTNYWADVLAATDIEPKSARRHAAERALEKFFHEEFQGLKAKWIKTADKLVADHQIDSAASSVPHQQRTIVQNLEVAAKLSGRLEGWSQQILNEELTWFKAHDRAPVWTLTIAAVLAATFRGIFTYINFWQGLPG